MKSDIDIAKYLEEKKEKIILIFQVVSVTEAALPQLFGGHGVHPGDWTESQEALHVQEPEEY